MKKKVTAMILALALSAGVVAPVPAYADGITVEETSMDTATEKSFDTDYTVKWDADKVYWNKVTLDQQGILRIHLNEEDPKSLENYDVAVYTAKGEKIWKIMVDCAGAAADNYVGLAKGTYYVSLQSHYQFRPSTTYRFSFEKNNACELEPNEKKNDAVDMKVNTMYTGFMENTYAGEKDNDDFYAIMHFMGSYSVWEKLFPNVFNEEIRKLTFENDDMFLTLYDFLVNHQTLEEANKDFDKMMKLITE